MGVADEIAGKSVADFPDDLIPLSFSEYSTDSSFFGGEAPLDEWVGYAVVLGFGGFFSIFTSLLVLADKYYGTKKEMTSEHFK